MTIEEKKEAAILNRLLLADFLAKGGKITICPPQPFPEPFQAYMNTKGN